MISDIQADTVAAERQIDDNLTSIVGSKVTGIYSSGEGSITLELDYGKQLITFEGEMAVYVTDRTIN